MNTAKWIVLLLIAALAGALLLALSGPQHLVEPLLSAPAAAQSSGSVVQITPVDLAYFAAILLGVIGKALWDALNQQLNGDVFSLRILLTRMALSIIIAVLIYATAINSVTDSKVLTLAGLSLAFQGGFFWQSLLQNLTETLTRQNTVGG